MIFDAGYDLTRLAWLLRDLPAGDRRQAAPATGSCTSRRRPGPHARPGRAGGRPRHGAVLKLCDPQTSAAPAVTTITGTTRYGTATAAAWGRLHQRLASRGGWQSHDGELPVIEGTLIRLQVEHLPGDRSPGPLWLWS